jgi:parallel beta-helix repeat protein
MANRVVTNGGAGITISGSIGTQVFGNEIRGNTGNGIVLAAAAWARIGADGSGNTIVNNTGYGLFATGNCARTRVVRNTVTGNTLGQVDISSATGITYVP